MKVYSEKQLEGFRKISESLKGRERSESHKAAISRAKKGKRLSAETRARMSAKLKERYAKGWEHPMQKYSFSKQEIEKALLENNSQEKAAQVLGASQMTVSRLKRKFGIDHDGKDNNRQTRGRGGWVGGKHMRSSWEIAFANALNEAGVVWQYEARKFRLGDGRAYKPDFWLPEHNTLVEIKGHWYPAAKEKFRLFLEQYPEEKIIVIEEKIWLLPLTDFMNTLLTRIASAK